nr:deoxyuridine 5'-triphosphate nucleotidohydrolase-like [Hydra vulgaris]
MNKSKDLQEALDHLTDLTLYKLRTNNYKMNDSCSIMNVDQDDSKGWSLYATKGSAAFELRSSEQIILLPFQRMLFSTGVFISKMDHDLQGWITSKSGLALNHGVTVFNSPGIIDSDYRDEICVILYNSSIEAYTVTIGQSIAQMTFVPVFFAERISWTVDKNKNSEMEIQSMLSNNERKGGFGSTGL